MKPRAPAVVALAFLLAGCLVLDPWDSVARELPTGADSDGAAFEAALDDASAGFDVPDTFDPPPPSAAPLQWMYDRAVWLDGCTGTRIAPRFIVTALRCLALPADGGASPVAKFYAFGPGPDPKQTAQVIALTSPPGTDGPSNDRTATNGDFADIVVAELDRDITTGAAAAINWTYNGVGAAGYKVGVEPKNNSDKLGVLRSLQDTTYSEDADGSFRTNHAYTDLGGSFYIGGRLIGVLSAPDGTRGRFTSLPHHLPWILDAIHYRWPGGPAIEDRALSGGAYYQLFTGTERTCQYACDLVSVCRGYNYVPTMSTCVLISSFTGTIPLAGARFAARWALRRGVSRGGDPVGYVRSDGIDAALHRVVAGGLDELYATAAAPGWAPTALTSAAAGRPSAIVRSDGVDAIVYRDASTAHVVEVSFVGGAWVETDLTAATGAPTAAGDPSAYVRVDGVTAIVYRSASSHVIELALGGSTWTTRDLTNLTSVITGTLVLAAGDPSAYVRADHYSAVVYRGFNGHVYEIYETPTGTLGAGDPFAVANATVAATGNPYGYVRHDGASAIAYRGTDGTIRELALVATWKWDNLTVAGAPPAAGNPVGYVRSDGTSAVVYRSTTGRIMELALVGTSLSWVATDLTNGDGATPTGDPSPYVRASGVNTVLFRSADNHVHELTLAGATWTAADLTDLAGETP